MRLRPFTLFAASLVVSIACQSYDFIPVQPLSISQEDSSTPIVIKKFKPNVMVLVDKSGSMDQPVNPSLAGCTTPNGLCGTGDNAKITPCNTTVCPTRWSQLNLALDSFLQTQAQTVRFGLSFFPEPGPGADQPNCIPTTAARVDLPADPDDDSEATLSALSQAARNRRRDADRSEPAVLLDLWSAARSVPARPDRPADRRIAELQRLHPNGELRLHGDGGLVSPGVHHQPQLPRQGPDGRGGEGPRRARGARGGHRARCRHRGQRGRRGAGADRPSGPRARRRLPASLSRRAARPGVRFGQSLRGRGVPPAVLP